MGKYIKMIGREHSAEKTRVIKSLWYQHASREWFYLKALGLECVGPMRKLLSKGHLSAILFQNELQILHETEKCCMTDECLSVDRKLDRETCQENAMDTLKCSEVAHLFKVLESQLLSHYQHLELQFDWDVESGKIIHEHIAMVTELYQEMSSFEHLLKFK